MKLEKSVELEHPIALSMSSSYEFFDYSQLHLYGFY